MKVDLHTHTTVSDGKLSPRELVALAHKRGIGILAITDHDSTDAIPEALEAAKAFPTMTLIPGIEMSIDAPHGEIHILGYFIDYKDADFQNTLVRLRESRWGRARKMVEKLAQLGMPVSWERVVQLAGEGSVGRPHIAQALLEKGYISSIQEAFIKYIGREGPAYAERQKLTAVEAVQLITRVHGLAVLAHPGDAGDIEPLLSQLKPAGLVGMEVYYNSYHRDVVNRLAKIARKHDLLPLGGSDYHGDGIGPGTELGAVEVPLEAALKLISMARDRKERKVQL